METPFQCRATRGLFVEGCLHSRYLILIFEEALDYNFYWSFIFWHYYIRGDLKFIVL